MRFSPLEFDSFTLIVYTSQICQIITKKFARLDGHFLIQLHIVFVIIALWWTFIDLPHHLNLLLLLTTFVIHPSIIKLLLPFLIFQISNHNFYLKFY